MKDKKTYWLDLAFSLVLLVVGVAVILLTNLVIQHYTIKLIEVVLLYYIGAFLTIMGIVCFVAIV